MTRKVNEMLKFNVNKESSNPWASPVVLIRRKTEIFVSTSIIDHRSPYRE